MANRIGVACFGLIGGKDLNVTLGFSLFQASEVCCRFFGCRLASSPLKKKEISFTSHLHVWWTSSRSHSVHLDILKKKKFSRHIRRTKSCCRQPAINVQTDYAASVSPAIAPTWQLVIKHIGLNGLITAVTTIVIVFKFVSSFNSGRRRKRSQIGRGSRDPPAFDFEKCLKVQVHTFEAAA